MSTALKDKKPYSQSEEQQEKTEYIEIKKRKEIQAILKAQKQVTQKQPIVPSEPIKPQKEVDEKQTEKKERKFIKDDRQRIYPKKVQQSKYSPQKRKQQQIETKPKQNYRERKNQSNNYEQQKVKKDRKRVEEVKDFQEKQDIHSKKVKYIQKSQQNTNKQSNDKSKQFKFKKRQQQYYTQIQQIKGKQYKIQLLDKEEAYDNQILIASKPVQIYVKICKKQLKNYQFILLKAYGQYVSKAFLVAGILGKQLRQLKQINIPSTTKVRSTGDQGNKFKTKGLIKIQLSLNSLNKHHVGYQNDKTRLIPEVKAPKYDNKPKYVERVIDQRALR